MSRRLVLRLLTVAGIALPTLALQACAGKPPPPPPPPPAYQFRVAVQVGPDANPDARQRPSPVVVRLYELKSNSQFETHDFLALSDKDTTLLAADIVARDEWTLHPGETRSVARVLKPETKFVAAMAGFRDLERSVWRHVLPVRAGADQHFELTLAGKTLALKPR